MSTPENILSKYRTFSYHHILIIADSVKTATDVSMGDEHGVSDLNVLIRDGEIKNYSSEIINTTQANGKYVIMANGFTDAHYVVEDLKWESVTGQQGNNGNGNYTAMVTEGAMVINEPRGIRFLNDVKKTYEKLGTDHQACVWMIKTIFVGHNDHLTNNPDKVEYITNIKPLIFVVVDMTTEYTVQGGVYDITFVNINNGVSKLPQINNITETMKLNLNDFANLTLGNALRTLFTKINDRYGEYFNTIKSKVLEDGMNPLPINYEIILSDYNDVKYKVDDIQQQNTTSGSLSSGPILDFSKSITIENAIKKVLSHCPQIKKDAKGDTNDDKFTYKIRTILDTDIAKKKYNIKYYVEKQKMMFSNVFDDVASKDTVLQQRLEENTLHLDYIFTGKNIDIIDYSMKMELGIVFFQQITSSNNLGNQQQSSANLSTTNNQTTEGKPINYDKEVSLTPPKKNTSNTSLSV